MRFSSSISVDNWFRIAPGPTAHVSFYQLKLLNGLTALLAVYDSRGDIEGRNEEKAFIVFIALLANNVTRFLEML